MKSVPSRFLGSSGVTHPLLSEAVTQFQAQAYKEMLPPGGPVKTQILGSRPRKLRIRPSVLRTL